MAGASVRKQRGNVRVSISVITIMGFENFVEEVQILGRDLVDKVRELIHEATSNGSS